MNKTHGDILHSPNTTSGPTLNDLVYRQRLEDTTTGGLSSNGTVSSYNPPRGEVGWICPVCGRGNAPSTPYCNCNMTKSDIVYATGGLTVRSAFDDATPCHTKMNEYITTSASSNSTYTTATNASK